MKKRKNDYLELCRFLACAVIFSYHGGGVFAKGWIFVEFFFIVSGYFTMKHFMNPKNRPEHPERFPMVYTGKKFLRLWPYIIVTMLMYSALTIYYFGLRGTQILKWMLYLPINLLLLPGTGVMPAGIAISDTVTTPRIMEPVLWYLAALFIAMPVFLYLLQYLYRFIGAWLISILPFFIYGFMIFTDGTIDGWHVNHMGFWMLDLRALAGLLLGALVWRLSEKIKGKYYTGFGRLLLSVVELFSLALAFLLATKESLSVEALQILLFVLTLTMTFSGQTVTSRIHSRVLAFLGKISFPVYCLHSSFIWIFNESGRAVSTEGNRWLAFGCIVLASIILYLLVEIGKAALKKTGHFWRKLVMVDRE